MSRVAWVGLSLIVATLGLTFLLSQLNRRAGKPLPILGTVSDFRLTNQLGQAVSLADLRGHVWIADFIFTRCPGPCLKMTRQMKELALAVGPETRLVSLTTDPEFDTPQVLKTYGDRFGADAKRWIFLTGPKEDVTRLGVQSLKLTALEKKPEERESAGDLFVHSTIFVLVDKQGRMRAFPETTGEGIDSVAVKRDILRMVRQLERE